MKSVIPVVFFRSTFKVHSVSAFKTSGVRLVQQFELTFLDDTPDFGFSTSTMIDRAIIHKVVSSDLVTTTDVSQLRFSQFSVFVVHFLLFKVTNSGGQNSQGLSTIGMLIPAVDKESM